MNPDPAESEKIEEIPTVFIQPKDCVLTVKWDLNYGESTPEKE